MIEWDVSYDAFQLPTKTIPTWTKRSDFSITTEEISPAGFLHLVSNTGGMAWYEQANSNLDNTVGTTVEVKVKIISGFTYAQQTDASDIYLYDGTYDPVMEIFTDAVVLRSPNVDLGVYYLDTTNTYHTYRFTLQGTTGKIYVDGIFRISSDAVANVTTHKRIAFTGADWWGGVVESSWDYVRYSAKGAFSLGGTAGEGLGNPC